MDGIGLISLLAGLLVSIVVIVIVVVILRLARRSAEKAVRSPEYWEEQLAEGDSELRELDRRLAAGEIDRQKYEHLRARNQEL